MILDKPKMDKPNKKIDDEKDIKDSLNEILECVKEIKREMVDEKKSRVLYALICLIAAVGLFIISVGHGQIDGSIRLAVITVASGIIVLSMGLIFFVLHYKSHS